MKLTPLMDPSILIIENREVTLQANEDYINAIGDDKKEKAGISKFSIDKAMSIEIAKRLLTARINSPYNIVLLDMHFPDSPTSRSESGSYVSQKTTQKVYRGFEILDFVKSVGAAEAVIVVSGYPENMLDVFRSGATDFIMKPRSAEELQGRVLTCWTRLLQGKSNQIFTDRIRDLVPYAEKGLAHRFTSCFSSLVRAVAHNSEDLENYMRERFGLDRRKHSEDFFFTCLSSQEESIAKAKQEWAALKSPFHSPDESSRGATVSTLLQEIHLSLLPSMIVKDIKLELVDEGASEILTFEDDVKAVLMEILSGAANTLQDFNEKDNTIKIRVTDQDGEVEVSFEDTLSPIPEIDAEQINKGSSISPLPRFGREWGLSVVQHIAMRGGGRLAVRPQPAGNIVTYFIPSVR